MRWLLVLCLCLSPLAAPAKEAISNYQVLFSPRDHLAEELISMIDKEKKTIRIAVYSLTHRGIFKALTHAKERGVNVEVIVDPYSLSSKSVLKQLKTPPFPIFVWNPAAQLKTLRSGKTITRKKPLMHDKFCVLGEDRVWTGSFNFTAAANAIHQENALVVENREIASSYIAEFERLKSSGCQNLTTYLAEAK